MGRRLWEKSGLFGTNVHMMYDIEKIKAAISRNYVFAEEAAEAIALGFASGENVLLWGPGGHGKSAMVMSIIAEMGMEDETSIMSFGEGTDEAALYGGLDMEALDHVIQYFPENSFLAKRIAVFEEVLDAPPVVLQSLKDTLTAKCLRKGAQVYPMKTKIIIGLSNKNPLEYAEGAGDDNQRSSTRALIERFGIICPVKWPDYSKSAYMALFEKVCPGEELGQFKGVLAEILANATAAGNLVSPRTAVKAYRVVLASARIHGRSVAKEDLVALRFLPGLEDLADSIKADVVAAMERQKGEQALASCSAEFEKLYTEYEAEVRVIQLMQISKRVSALLDRVAAVKVPDSLTSQRKALREKIAQLAEDASAKALKNVRV